MKTLKILSIVWLFLYTHLTPAFSQSNFDYYHPPFIAPYGLLGKIKKIRLFPNTPTDTVSLFIAPPLKLSGVSPYRGDTLGMTKE